MLEEVGARYESVPVSDPRDPAFRGLNPNGRVPTLVDGELVLFESLAINLYLAKRFVSDLSARTPAEEAWLLQWSFWAENELEAFFNDISTLEEIPETFYAGPLRVLDDVLAEGTLVGGRFTVADLNVANMFNGPISAQLDLSRHGRVDAWLAASRRRPAARRVLERVRAALKRP